MATRQGPALTIAGSCEGCAYLITDARDPRLGRGPHAACVHPERANGGLIFARARGPWPMPGGCPLFPAARLALLVDLARTLCRQCGSTVEPERECYVIPTCFACLPPPPPMTVLPSFAAWQKKQEEEGASVVVPMVTREEPSR